MKVSNKVDKENLEWLAGILGTPENIKKLTEVLYPTMTVDKM